MILAVDVGNSNITLGGFLNGELAFSARISTDSGATADDYAARIVSTLELYRVGRDAFSGSIIGSVAPQLNSVIRHALRCAVGVNPILVGPGIKTGVSIQCDSPSTVGADLIAACVAAHFHYGSPALIVDMDTVTKLTATSASGAFVGASIAPGVMMGLTALSSETAQLPRISPEQPGTIIAKNTADCMRSGVLFGNACLVDGMIERIKREMNSEPHVIVTGAYAPMVLPLCESKMTYDEHLILKGLYLIYKKNV